MKSDTARLAPSHGFQLAPGERLPVPPHWQRSPEEFYALNLEWAYWPNPPAPPEWWTGKAKEFWDKRLYLFYTTEPPAPDAPIEEAIGWRHERTLYDLPVHMTPHVNPFLQAAAPMKLAAGHRGDMSADGEDPPLTRDAFPDPEDYARYFRNSGLDPRDERGNAIWVPMDGDGPQARLHRAVHGATKRQFQRTWEGYGHTNHLRNRHFATLYNALAFANCRGWVMNAFISIAWSSVGITSDLLVQEANGLFNERMRKWLSNRGLPLAWVWVVERGRTHGLHSHVHAHVPKADRRDFKLWAMNCVETIAKQPLLVTPTSKTVDIDYRPNRDVRGQWRRFRYYAKGTDPDLVLRDAADPHVWHPLHEVAGLRLKPQGLRTLKPVGVSRALDQKARKDFDARYELPTFALAKGATEPADLYTDEYLRWHDAMLMAGKLNS